MTDDAPIDWTTRSTPLGPPAAPTSGPTAYQQPYAPPPPGQPGRRQTGLIVGLAAALVILLGGAAVITYAATRPAAGQQAAGTPSASSNCDPSKLKLSGCGDGQPPPAAPVPPQVDPNTAAACDANDKMRNSSADLVTQGEVIARIQALVSGSDFEVRFAGNMLKDRYDLAAAARRNHLDETADDLDLFTASINLSTACIKDGWRPTPA